MRVFAPKHLSAAFRLHALGRPDEAADEIREAIAMAPDWGKRHFYMGTHFVLARD